jgi:PPP family 3-phenylpropionic acid transporter
LRDPSVIWLLVLGLLMYASHGAYYGFFSLQLSAVGFDKTVIGLLWALAVLCEIALFVWTPRLIRAHSIRILMVSCFALTALRWVTIAWLPEVWGLLILAQALHAVSFGLFHAVTISFMGQVFTEPFRTRGQALFSTIAFGVGGALGSFSSGLLWESGGGLFAFGAAAILAVLGLVIAFTMAPRNTQTAN